MHKKEKMVIAAKNKKAPVPVRKLPPESKDQTMLLFTQQSDELAAIEALKRKERQKQKVEFLNAPSINVDDLIANVMAKHETRFHKSWFYKLAILYGVDPKIMDQYIKPDFVRVFIIQFVYGRFPYLLLRTLRSKNRKLAGKAGKLHQHLRKDAVEQLETVIKQVSDTIDISGNALDFKMRYSREYRLHFQLEAF
jgi:hypothetical protein